MVLRAAPLRRLSPERKSANPFSTVSSVRIRPTIVGSVPAASNGVGTSDKTTPGESDNSSVALSGVRGLLNLACIESECPVKTGTLTHVPDTLRSGIPSIFLVSFRSFCSSSVSSRPSSIKEPA
ncbi:MAG: Uncharacterised protein [Acidimicrobiaceae bacterium]|nr:MAG: Uncharacterised protein [Acidimicrobiaceae bacterium]